MDQSEQSALLRDPHRLLAHYASLVERLAGEHGLLEVCSLGFLNPAAARAMRVRVRRQRWRRRVTLGQVRDLSVERSDTESVVAGVRALDGWLLIADPWMNWPQNEIEQGYTAGSGAAVIVDWRPRNPVVLSYLSGGRTVFASDLRDGPGQEPMGAGTEPYRHAIAQPPWSAGADPRAVAFAAAARLTATVLDEQLLTGRFATVLLANAPVDESDLLREFHDYPAAHEPALLAIVADTRSEPTSVRQIAVQSALIAARRAGVSDHPPIAAALAALAAGTYPDGSAERHQGLLTLIEPQAAIVREHTGRPDLPQPDGWYELVAQVGAYQSVASAFLPDPYRAATGAWAGIPMPSFYLPGTQRYDDDHVRCTILVRCIHRARETRSRPRPSPLVGGTP